MNHNKINAWITGLAFSASIVSAPAFSASVFEDLFDQQSVTSVPFSASSDSEWQVRSGTIRGVPTRASIGNGVLSIATEEGRFGGVSSSRSNTYDFFNQELTYTFAGFNLSPVGPEGKLTNQWAKVGVIAGDGSLWYASSYFIIAFNGTGQFSVQVQQPSLTSRNLEKITIKEFNVPYFNFDVSLLSKVQLVLDDTHFRILFVFGNELDQLSFGGTHNLDRNRWFFDTAGLGRAESALNSAKTTLDNAKLSGNQASIDSAQATYDSFLAQYNIKVAEAEPLKGDTSILISAASNDASVLRNVDGITNVGAALTLDRVSVDTTNTLSVLKNSNP